MYRLEGQRFGKLCVLKRRPESMHHKSVFYCVCDCGNFVLAYGYKLAGGLTVSCGCVPHMQPKRAVARRDIEGTARRKKRSGSGQIAGPCMSRQFKWLSKWHGAGE